jgi:hypothetical protein
MTRTPIQVGPVYTCWVCGAPAKGLRGYRETIVGPTVLDDWADHIAYLRLPESCRLRHHPTRVARLGAAITPLRFAYDNDPGYPESVEERIRAIQEAVARLAREVGPQGAPEPDPAASIVYRLLAGVLAPETAIEEIRELLSRPVAVTYTVDQSKAVITR